MTKLEDLERGYVVEGLCRQGPVKIKSVRRFSNRGIEVVYLDVKGNLVSNFFLSDQQPDIEVLWAGGPAPE